MCVVGGKALKPDKMQTDTNDEPKAGALGTDRVLREKKHPMEKFLGDAESLLNCSAASYFILSLSRHRNELPSTRVCCIGVVWRLGISNWVIK